MAQTAGALASSLETRSILSQFSYGEVELLEGPMRQQFDANHAFFLALNEDMLLKPFRERAGQPAPGDNMGGWYDNSAEFDPRGSFHGFIPGHSFGQYLSALSRAYSVTGSKPTQAKVRRLVRALAPTIATRFYDDYHLPAYTFDKTGCGLIDAHEFAADEAALDVLNAATDAVLPHLPRKALSRSEQYALPQKDEAYCWDETYTLPENLFLAYRRGGGNRYRDLAIRFLEDDLYFNPLSEEKNVLPGEHAYSHVNAFSSAMQAYLVLGSEKHLRAAQNGFEFLRTTQSFATGGWGPDELFRKPGSGEMGESLRNTHSSFETPCGAYGHFKIARYLLRVTRDSRYGDSMERVLYNTILGAKPLKEDGTSFYYSDYNDNFASKGGTETLSAAAIWSISSLRTRASASRLASASRSVRIAALSASTDSNSPTSRANSSVSTGSSMRLTSPRVTRTRRLWPRLVASGWLSGNLRILPNSGRVELHQRLSSSGRARP